MSMHYEALMLPRSATLAEVRTSWKKLIVKTHPDKNGGDDEMFQRVQGAYEAIQKEQKKTPEQKRRDDARRKHAQRQTQYQAKRKEERAAAAAMFARAREERERAAAERREAEEAKLKEVQAKERRINVEGRMAYEQRVLRERQEAYLRRHEEKRKAFEAQQASAGSGGLSWADRQQARHQELFQSRYAKYMAQKELKAEKVEKAEGGSPSSSAAASSPQAASPSSAQAATQRQQQQQQQQQGSSPSEQQTGAGAADGSDEAPKAAGAEVPRAAQADKDSEPASEPAVESAFDFWERRRAEAMAKLNSAMNLYPTTSGLNGEDALFGIRLAMFER
jgi:curved DNA-binding protein CbpA